jgi:hypothetical protein
MVTAPQLKNVYHLANKLSFGSVHKQTDNITVMHTIQRRQQGEELTATVKSVFYLIHKLELCYDLSVDAAVHQASIWHWEIEINRSSCSTHQPWNCTSPLVEQAATYRSGELIMFIN